MCEHYMLCLLNYKNKNKSNSRNNNRNKHKNKDKNNVMSENMTMISRE